MAAMQVRFPAQVNRTHAARLSPSAWFKRASVALATAWMRVALPTPVAQAELKELKVGFSHQALCMRLAHRALPLRVGATLFA